MKRVVGLARDILHDAVAVALLVGQREEDVKDGGYSYTLPSMTAALGLYKQAGFVEVAPYSTDPTPGAVYLGVMVSDTELFSAGDGADD